MTSYCRQIKLTRKKKTTPFRAVAFWWFGRVIVALLVLNQQVAIGRQKSSKFTPLFPLELKEVGEESTSLNGLPRGIIHARSDLDLKPLWLTSSSKSKANVSGPCYLLAIPVVIKQMDNVDTIVQKFLSENFIIVLFHYDGKVDGWWNLEWSNDAIHIVAQNQTKWWFAKRFLHSSVVAIYDYIFLWDEELGVEHFNPRRYL